MSLKHTWNTSIKTDTGGGVTDSVVYTATAEENVSELVPAGEVGHVVMSIDVSQIKSFFCESDQPVTLNTNSNISPTQSIPLSAKRAFGWNTDRHEAKPLTSDITDLYWDNSAGLVDANVKASFLLDL